MGLFPFVILIGFCIDSFLNILKSHQWNFIIPCKHTPIFKTYITKTDVNLKRMHQYCIMNGSGGSNIIQHDISYSINALPSLMTCKDAGCYTLIIVLSCLCGLECVYEVFDGFTVVYRIGRV